MPKKHLSSNPSDLPSIPTLPSTPGVPGWSSSIPIMSLRALPGWTMPKKLTIPLPGVSPKMPHLSQNGGLSQISNLDKQVAPLIRKVLLERQQASICSLPKMSGPCRSAFPRFYFDAEKGQCVKLIYGGCTGFLTSQDCLTTCMPATIQL